MEKLTTFVTVYRLNWGSPSIGGIRSDGLWDNNNVLAIHWPTFSGNFLNGRKLTPKYINKFYYSYSENDNIKPINFKYFKINDIVTNNKVWDYCKKIIVYYEVDD